MITKSIDDVLDEARQRLQRVTPIEAYHEQALLVDIRPAGQRAAEGEIPGALIVERNVLEWRLDPASAHRIAQAIDHDVHIVVICSGGYQSSLAAAVLQDLGLHRATDLDGGAQAWIAAGLPVETEGS